MALVDGESMLQILKQRHECLKRALEGLAEHGMLEVETSPLGVEQVTSELMVLPTALQAELDRMAQNCRLSLQKLNRTFRTLAPSAEGGQVINVRSSLERKSSKNGSCNEIPSECNHQRLMNCTQSNIQVRFSCLFKCRISLCI